MADYTQFLQSNAAPSFAEQSDRSLKFTLSLLEQRKKDEEERKKQEEEARQFNESLKIKQAELERKARQDEQNSADEYLSRWTTMFDKVADEPEIKSSLIEAYNSSKYAQKNLLPMMPKNLKSFRKLGGKSSDLELAREAAKITLYNSLDPANKAIFDTDEEQLSSGQESDIRLLEQKKQWNSQIEQNALNRVLDNKKQSTSNTVNNIIDDKKVNAQALTDLKDSYIKNSTSYNNNKDVIYKLENDPTYTGKFASLKTALVLNADALGLSLPGLQKAQSAEELRKQLNLTSLMDVKKYLSGATSDRDLIVLRQTVGEIDDPVEVLSYVFKQRASDSRRNMFATQLEDELIRKGESPVQAASKVQKMYGFQTLSRMKTIDRNGNAMIKVENFDNFADRLQRSNPGQDLTGAEIAEAWKEFIEMNK